MKIIQKYDLSKMQPILQNDNYALYGLGFINEITRKGVRVDKRTGEQVDVIVQTVPGVRVIEIIKNGIQQKLY